MTSLGFKPAKAEIQVSTSDDTVSGSTGLTSGMSQENQTSSNDEDVDFDHNTDELRASPNALHPRV